MQATDARRIGGNPILLSVLKSREEFQRFQLTRSRINPLFFRNKVCHLPLRQNNMPVRSLQATPLSDNSAGQSNQKIQSPQSPLLKFPLVKNSLEYDSTKREQRQGKETSIKKYRKQSGILCITQPIQEESIACLLRRLSIRRKGSINFEDHNSRFYSYPRVKGKSLSLNPQLSKTPSVNRYLYNKEKNKEKEDKQRKDLRKITSNSKSCLENFNIGVLRNLSEVSPWEEEKNEYQPFRIESLQIGRF